MKLKTIMSFGLGLAVAAMLTTNAKASITFYWNPSSATRLVDGGYADMNAKVASSGILTYSGGIGGTISDYTFVASGPGVSISDSSVLPVTGTSQTLGDNDLLISTPPGNVLSVPSFGIWYDNFPNIYGPANENLFELPGFGSGAFITGDWKLTPPPSPVPEPATLISGALLLLPFGASSLRILRKNRAA